MAVYGPESHVGTAIALPVLAVIAVCLRFYVRLRLRHAHIGPDDWLILLAVIFVCGHGIIQVMAVYLGVAGQDDEPPEQRSKARLAFHRKLSKSIVILEKFTYCFIKLSVLFLYRRIFGVNRKFLWATNTLIVLIISWGILFIFLESFICVSSSSSSTTCSAQEWALLWFGITEVIGDILILSLPYPMIRRLQTSRRDKVGLTVIFALGTLSTMIGLIRLGYVSESFYWYFHPDFKDVSGSAPGFWTTAEVSIGVVAACLPVLGPLFRMIPAPKKTDQSFRQRLLFTRSRRRTSGSTTQKPSTSSVAVDSATVHPEQKPKTIDAQPMSMPVLPLVLPTSHRFSQLPAEFMADNNSHQSIVSNGSFALEYVLLETQNGGRDFQDGHQDIV